MKNGIVIIVLGLSLGYLITSTNPDTDNLYFKKSHIVRSERECVRNGGAWKFYKKKVVCKDGTMYYILTRRKHENRWFSGI